MNERVEEYLANHEKKLDYEDDIYYYMVMKKAHLLKDEVDFYPCTKDEYDYAIHDDAYRKKQGDIYYVKKKLPLDLSDEEFKAVEATFPPEILQSFKDQASCIKTDEEIDGNSTAATFFSVLAWILWIGGLIVAIVSANVTVTNQGYYSTYTESQFSFTVFMSAFIIYFISGCFAMCAAELFKKLQTIVNLLRRKS